MRLNRPHAHEKALLAHPMKIEIAEASLNDKTVLRRLLEFSEYELSEFDGYGEWDGPIQFIESQGPEAIRCTENVTTMRPKDPD